jgi:hypothetical protein
VHDLLVRWRHGVRGAVGLAVEAQNVGDFPLWVAVLCPASRSEAGGWWWP